MIHCAHSRRWLVSLIMSTKVAQSNKVPVYVSRSGVALLLGVSPNTVTRWAREGRLPSHLTLGGHHRFERSVIEKLRDETQSPGSVPYPGTPFARK